MEIPRGRVGEGGEAKVFKENCGAKVEFLEGWGGGAYGYFLEPHIPTIKLGYMKTKFSHFP